MSLRRPPGARARARDQERSEQIMAELAHTRRFLNRSTSIDVSVHVLHLLVYRNKAGNFVEVFNLVILVNLAVTRLMNMCLWH